MIDKSILKYIPKQLQKNVVWADKWKNKDTGKGFYYCIAFKFDGEPSNEDGDDGYTCYNCIGVDDIKWYCKQVLNGRRGCDW